MQVLREMQARGKYKIAIQNKLLPLSKEMPKHVRRNCLSPGFVSPPLGQMHAQKALLQILRTRVHLS